MSDFDNLPPDYSVGQSVDGSLPVVPGLGISSAGTGQAQAGFAVDGEGTRKASDWSDAIGKGIDLLGGEKNPLTAAIGATMSLPGDAIKTKDGIDEMRDGHFGAGLFDTAAAAAGVIGDLGNMAGNEKVGNIAGGAKGIVEAGKGGGELAAGIKNHDSDQELQGVVDLTNGIGDGTSALPGDAGKVGKAFNFGLSAGNAIAPYVFGDKSKDASVQTSDGVWHGSTGNDWVDWAAGVGRYSNSRWGSDTPSDGGSSSSSDERGATVVPAAKLGGIHLPGDLDP